MKKLLALCLIIAGTLLVGVGLAKLNESPPVAVFTVGVGLILWIIAWRFDRKRPVVVPEGTQPFPAPGLPLEVRRKPGKTIALFVAIGLFVAAMTLPLFGEDTALWPYVLAVGAVAGGACAWQMLRHSPYLRIEAMGFSGKGQRLLPWREIEGVRVFGITHKGHTQNHMHLRVTRPDAHMDRVSGLARWQLRKNAVLHFPLYLTDTDPLVLFEAVSRHVAAAHEAPVLTGFSAETKWADWVRDHVRFGDLRDAPEWQSRINALHLAMLGGWSHYDDCEASSIKLNLLRAEHARHEAVFADLDRRLEEAAARNASASEMEAMIDRVVRGPVVETPEVAAAKAALAEKARKVKRNNMMAFGVIGVVAIIWLWAKVT